MTVAPAQQDDGYPRDLERVLPAKAKLSVDVEGFVPRRSNTLYGFVTIVVPEIHLRICDISVHQKESKRWASLPSKPQIDRAGQVRKADNGKLLYVPVIEFTDKPTRDAFSAKVIIALLEFAPAAFSDEEAA